MPRLQAAYVTPISRLGRSVAMTRLQADLRYSYLKTCVDQWQMPRLQADLRYSYLKTCVDQWQCLGFKLTYVTPISRLV
jgi:hypothetical protein